MSASAIRLAKLVRDDLPRARTESARLLAADKQRKGRVRVKAGERKGAGRDAAKERFERLTKIREAVFARAGKQCETYYVSTLNGKWYRCEGVPAILDHWEGGVGRRRQREGVETCWAVCMECNGNRTANWPDAGFWNESFANHAKAHGYRFTPHFTRAQSYPNGRNPR